MILQAHGIRYSSQKTSSSTNSLLLYNFNINTLLQLLYNKILSRGLLCTMMPLNQRNASICISGKASTVDEVRGAEPDSASLGAGIWPMQV